MRNTVGDDPALIVRPASFVLRRQEEDEREMRRLIMLPPRGYTADAPNKMNSHDEAERATIRVLGGVRPHKKGFSKLRDCLLFAGRKDDGTTSSLEKPYMTYDLSAQDSGLATFLLSAGQPPVHVVRPDGFGFYHNLSNLTEDWQMLELHKTCRPMRKVDLLPHLDGLPGHHANALKRLYQGILLHGDGVFSQMPSAIRDVEAIPVAKALPAVGEMLYVRETGRHEACTAFALILKLAQKDPVTVSRYLHETREAKTIPPYYGQQLALKIQRSGKGDGQRVHAPQVS